VAAARTAGQAPPAVSVPVGFTTFRGQIWAAPRSWVETLYPGLAYFNEVDRGGHFAAWEQPALFAAEGGAEVRITLPLRFPAPEGGPNEDEQPYGGRNAPRPSAVVMAYTAHTDYASGEPPTFVVVGEEDRIATPAAMERRVQALRRAGTEVEYRRYPNLGHGFGPGTGTSAEGWIFDAIRFWETSMRGRSGTHREASPTAPRGPSSMPVSFLCNAPRVSM